MTLAAFQRDAPALCCEVEPLRCCSAVKQKATKRPPKTVTTKVSTHDQNNLNNKDGYRQRNVRQFLQSA